MEQIKMTNKVIYLCDERVCDNCGYPTCMHTTNIEHAVNFRKVDDNTFMEKEPIPAITSTIRRKLNKRRFLK